jgi:hypothetical protein
LWCWGFAGRDFDGYGDEKDNVLRVFPGRIARRVKYVYGTEGQGTRTVLGRFELDAERRRNYKTHPLETKDGGPSVFL